MIDRAKQSFVNHKRRYLPVAIALALALGIFISVTNTPNAQADYAVGCGYGYNSAGGGFGYGTGNAFGYGYGNGGTFKFGYGDQVCPEFVTTTSPPSGTVGVAYSTQLTGTGGTNTYTWALTSGALPSGLTLSGSGLISGTPTTAQTSGFNVTMTDSNGQPVTKTLSITINPLGGGTTTTIGGGGTTTTTLAGGTTTTLAGGTTTTLPNTTTTVPSGAPKHPSGCRLSGSIRSRKTTDITITGTGFYAQPTLRSTEGGFRGIVRHDTGTNLRAVVQIRSFGGKGHTFTLTVRDADGNSCRVNYVLH